MLGLLSLLRQEIPLLRLYIVHVVKHWRAMVGSAVVIVMLWVAAHYGTIALSRMVAFVPAEIIPWLTRNRLLVLSFVAVFLVAQYRAWREAWLGQGAEKPRLPKGLTIRQKVYRNMHDYPEMTEFILNSVADLRGKALRIVCSGPIYDKWVYINKEPVGWDVLRDDDTNSFILNLYSAEVSGEPITSIRGDVYSTGSLRVIRVEWVDLKTAASARPS